jgi:hypothetical protein
LIAAGRRSSEIDLDAGIALDLSPFASLTATSMPLAHQLRIALGDDDVDALLEAGTSG